MSNVLRLAIVDPNDASRESLKSMLLGMDSVWLEAECSRYEFFADVIDQTHPDVGLVTLDHNPDKAIRLLEELSHKAPDCALLVVSPTGDGQIILKVMRSGAREFLTQPVRVDDLVAALERIGQQRFGRSDSRSRGSSVIAICGSTGGVGSTSLAVNLGCVLGRKPGVSAALIDLDLALGDADVFLDTIPDYTLVDVAQNIARLDFSLLKRSLTRHSSGLYLLPRPIQLQDTALIKPDEFHRVIGLLKATFSHLIFDLSKSYTPVDSVALQAAQHILLITQLDLPCLRNVVRLLASLDEIEGLKEKIKVIVNRVGLDSGQISLKKAQETIGRDIFWQIPNDYRVMSEVRNNGTPLTEVAARAGITQAIAGLADALSGNASDDRPDGESPTLSRWLSFWPSKSKTKSK